MSNNTTLHNQTLDPKELIKKRLNHLKTQSVFQCAKRQLDKYNISQEQLFKSSLGIKEENDEFLASYSSFKNRPQNNPNLIFKATLNHYRNKGYSINDLSKTNLFQKTPLLDPQPKHASKFQQEEADVYKVKTKIHSEKIKKYILKLDHIILKKKMVKKGIYKHHLSNMTITTRANNEDTNNNNGEDNDTSSQIINLKSAGNSSKHNKSRSLIEKENNELRKYNKALANLVKKETMSDFKRNPLFLRQKTFKMKSIHKKTDTVVSFDHHNNKAKNDKKAYDDSNTSGKKNKFLTLNTKPINYEEDSCPVKKKESDNLRNRIVNRVCFSIDKNIPTSVTHKTAMNFSPMTSSEVTLSEGCSLEAMNRYDSYPGIKRQIMFYLKKSNYTELQIDNLMKNCSGYHDLLKLISKLKKQTMSYDIKNKTPSRPEGKLRERLEDIELSIRFLDRNYINKLYKTYNQ